MKKYILISRSGILALSIVGLIWSLGTFVGSDAKADEAPHIVKEESIGIPLRLKIPTIAVSVPIEKVNIAKDGSMDVPKNPKNAGWYEPGIRPGDIGSAVIDGHLNWFQGVTGAFADLHKLKPGDKITVEDDIGNTIDFIIREVRVYDPKADTTNIFSSHDGKAHLNLITCGGIWNKRTKQYTERLVVFSDRTE